MTIQHLQGRQSHTEQASAIYIVFSVIARTRRLCVLFLQLRLFLFTLLLKCGINPCDELGTRSEPHFWDSPTDALLMEAD